MRHVRLVRYIKQKKKLSYDGDVVYYKIDFKYKEKKVKLYEGYDDGEFSFKEIIDDYVEQTDEELKDYTKPHMEIIKKNKEYFLKPADENEKIEWCNNPYDNSNTDDNNKANEKGAYVGFNSCNTNQS